MDYIEELTSRGLTNNEATLFHELLKKIILTEEDIQDYETELDHSPIPFEGGMGFIEALTGLKISLEYDFTTKNFPF